MNTDHPRLNAQAMLLLLTGVLWFVVVGMVSLSGQPADTTQAPDPRIAAWDKGPNKIDVSSYPKEMQERYKVFAAKCAFCHPLARTINCDLVLDDEWAPFIKQMVQMAGTLISADDGVKIYEFLVYDSKIRKKDLYAEKLAAAGGN